MLIQSRQFDNVNLSRWARSPVRRQVNQMYSQSKILKHALHASRHVQSLLSVYIQRLRQPQASNTHIRDFTQLLEASTLTSLFISSASGGGLPFLHCVNVPLLMSGDTRNCCDFSSKIPTRGRINLCTRDRHAKASRQKSFLRVPF